MNDRVAVTMLEVASEAVWDELAAQVDVSPHLGQTATPTRRVVTDEPALIETLTHAGLPPLARFARRDAADIAAHRDALDHRVHDLQPSVRYVLSSAQRHALEEVVLDLHAWDPVRDAEAVTVLHALGMLVRLPSREGVTGTQYRLPTSSQEGDQ